MKLVRTFHPVGHGAFYTERFYEGGECVFTAVYDCGGNPEGGIDSYVQNWIEDCKNHNRGNQTNGNRWINALFISHFHKDHINGIKKLLPYCNKIFIPTLTKNEIAEDFVHNAITDGRVDTVSNELLTSFYNETNEYSSRVVFVSKPNSDDNNRFDGIDNENKHRKDLYINNISTGKIPNGTPLYVSSTFPCECKWIYLPFNIDLGEKNKELKKFLSKMVNENGVVDKIKLQKFIDDITVKGQGRKYKKMFEDNPNHHSMPVYSGYCKPCGPYFHHKCCCLCECDCKNNGTYPFNNNCLGRYDDIFSRANCLYTGDVIASHENINKLIDYYGKYWIHCYTIQAPHHGSSRIVRDNKENKLAYGYALYRFCKRVIISTKPGQYRNIPSTTLLDELKKRNINTIKVTKQDNQQDKYPLY